MDSSYIGSDVSLTIFQLSASTCEFMSIVFSFKTVTFYFLLILILGFYSIVFLLPSAFATCFYGNCLPKPESTGRTRIQHTCIHACTKHAQLMHNSCTTHSTQHSTQMQHIVHTIHTIHNTAYTTHITHHTQHT